uniref:protein shisa-4-like isoform X2 n=1 Tax=Myxine glutinosa TaxID=7769 RepID=UPI00358E2B1D
MLALALLVFYCCHHLVSAGNDCLSFMTNNGSWHDRIDCRLGFCCGDCNRRYCCFSLSQRISENTQRRCSMHMSAGTVVGIVTSVIAFLAVISIVVCCFMCSCCLLHRLCRRQHSQSTTEQFNMGTPSVQSPYPQPFLSTTYTSYGSGPSYPAPTYPMAPVYPSAPGFPIAPTYPPVQPYPQGPLYPAYPEAPPPYEHMTDFEAHRPVQPQRGGYPT